MITLFRLTGALSALCVALAAIAIGAAAAKPHARHARKSRHQPAVAQLDPSFGRGGTFSTATTPPEAGLRQPARLAAGAGGEDYVLQGATVLAFDEGRPDARFGGNGRIRVVPGPGKFLVATGIAVDSHGRVLVAGTYEPFPGYHDRVVKGAPKYPAEVSVTEAFVARYRPDGKLDPNFGSGGVAVTTLGLPRPTDMPSFNTLGSAEYERSSVAVDGLLVDSQDRPVLAGEYLEAIENCGWGTSFPQSYVARLTSAGAVDPSFGDSGYVKVPGGAIAGFAAAPAGDLAVLSSHVYPCSEHSPGPGPWTTSVLTEAGAPSPTLDPARPTIVDPTALVLDGKGRIIYAEGGGNPLYGIPGQVKVVRLLANGDLDSSFGHDGAANLTRFGHTAVGGITVDARNRLVTVLGLSRPELIRIGTAGKLDHSFGRRGVLRAKIQRVASSTAEAVAIDPEGRIVVAGRSEGGALKTGWGVGIARFLPGR